MDIEGKGLIETIRQTADISSLKELYRTNMSDITPQEALEFLEQANYFPITPDSHAEMD